MKINVLYFGKIAVDVQIKNEIIDIPGASCSVKEMIAMVVARHEGIRSSTYRVAVNRALKNENDFIVNLDEVAFLPPYAGG